MPLQAAAIRGLAELLAPAFESLVPSTLRALMPPLGGSPGVAEIEAWFAALSDENLRRVLGQLGAHERVLTAMAQLTPASIPRGESPPHVIITGMPVVDRIEFWARLQMLHTGKSRILQVRGGRSAGKTYTKWLVAEFCRRLGPPHEAHLFDLDGFMRLEAIANEVMAAVVANQRCHPFDEADTTFRAWGRVVARQVFKALKAPGTTRWIVFDHFERTTRSDAAITFFLQLTELVAVEARDPSGPRLILIDHGVDVATLAQPVTLEEEVQTVTASDIAFFVRRCRPDWSDEQLEDEVKRIVSNLTRPEQYMTDLHDQARALVE